MCCLLPPLSKVFCSRPFPRGFLAPFHPPCPLVCVCAFNLAEFSNSHSNSKVCHLTSYSQMPEKGTRRTQLRASKHSERRWSFIENNSRKGWGGLGDDSSRPLPFAGLFYSGMRPTPHVAVRSSCVASTRTHAHIHVRVCVCALVWSSEMRPSFPSLCKSGNMHAYIHIYIRTYMCVCVCV